MGNQSCPGDGGTRACGGVSGAGATSRNLVGQELNLAEMQLLLVISLEENYSSFSPEAPSLSPQTMPRLATTQLETHQPGSREHAAHRHGPLQHREECV